MNGFIQHLLNTKNPCHVYINPLSFTYLWLDEANVYICTNSSNKLDNQLNTIFWKPVWVKVSREVDEKKKTQKKKNYIELSCIS